MFKSLRLPSFSYRILQYCFQHAVTRGVVASTGTMAVSTGNVHDPSWRSGGACSLQESEVAPNASNHEAWLNRPAHAKEKPWAHLFSLAARPIPDEVISDDLPPNPVIRYCFLVLPRWERFPIFFRTPVILPFSCQELARDSTTTSLESHHHPFPPFVLW